MATPAAASPATTHGVLLRRDFVGTRIRMLTSSAVSVSDSGLRRGLNVHAFVRRLAVGRIGRTYNQYAESAACRDRPPAYLEPARGAGDPPRRRGRRHRGGR